MIYNYLNRLRRALAERVELMQTYVRLHGLALQVQGAWDNVEAKCQELSVTNDDQQDPSVIIRQVEELWLDGQQKFLQLNQLGRNFMADAIKVLMNFTMKSHFESILIRWLLLLLDFRSSFGCSQGLSVRREFVRVFGWSSVDCSSNARDVDRDCYHYPPNPPRMDTVHHHNQIGN